MDLVAEAAVPVDFDQMGDALAVIIKLVQDRCVPTPASSVDLFLSETGFKGVRLLAEAFPATQLAFTVDRYDPRHLLPAREILAEASGRKLKDTCCNAKLTDFLPFDSSISLLDRLRQEFSPSGRGMAIQLTIVALLARDAPDAVQVDVSFQRWRSGSKRKSATVRLSCPARDKRDAVAKRDLLATADALGVKIGKPSYQAPLGRGVPTPEPLLLLNTYHAYQAAFDRSTSVIDASGIALAMTPFLMPRFEASSQRIQDVLAGRSEEIDLVMQLKRMMRESGLGYQFEHGDSETVLFVKSLTPHLEARLTFERFHNQGLGKSFTAMIGVGFPNDRRLQVGPIAMLFRDSLFRLFHRAPDQPAWVYATSDELAAALADCRSILDQTLQPIESQFTACLGEPSATLPSGIAAAGALSARESEAMARTVAQRWSDDIRLRAVSLITDSVLSTALGPALDTSGRLKPHGSWQMSYDSPRSGAQLIVTARHTGAIRWERMSGLPQSPTGTARVPADFVDSTRLADTVTAEVQRLTTGTGLRVIDTQWILGGSPRWDSDPVWTVRILLADPAGPQRRDRYLKFSPITGALISSEDAGLAHSSRT